MPAAPRSKKPPPLSIEQQIGLWLRLAVQRHAENFYRCFGTSLTQRQFSALVHLHLAGPCSQNSLGRAIGLDAASIVGVVRRLESQDLISIRKSDHDRRMVIIDTTAAGQRILRRTAELGRRANEKTLMPLSRPERKTLMRLLERVATFSADE
jgi:MarR family transcriptional regulator, lower aerobic nicotinate degradation pathway regulator